MENRDMTAAHRNRTDGSYVHTRKTKLMPALAVALAALVVTLPAAHAIAQTHAPANPTPGTRPVAKEAVPLLAERMRDIAAETLQGTSLSTAKYRQAGAFLEAASRLNPNEPRFHLLRYEALLQAGEIQSAIEALVQYARLDPTDLQAQAKLIELYTQRMETADDKLKYLRQDLIPTTSIPAEVRSHAAVMACRVLLERGERQAAIGMAGEAARLNPLDPEAQRLKFDLSLRDGTPVDRLGGLLSIVRASPLELGAVMSVADELSKAGLDSSAEWYDAALGLSLRNGVYPAREMAVNYAARLFMSGETDKADGLVNKILAGDPSDVSAQFVRLSMDRLQGMPADVERHKTEARVALTNRLAEIAKAAGDSNATTRPYDTAQPIPPDPIMTAARVLALNNESLKTAYIAAASDLAFFNLFFAESPGPAADLIDGLKKVLPPESPLLARLEGWLYLVKKQPAEARQRLSAVEANDPLAALGLLRLEPDSADGRQAADTRARGLRSSNSHGVTGAILYSDLQPRKTPLVPTAQADQLKKLLDQFPKQLLRLIDSPDTFYYLKAEPLNGSAPFGSPLLIRVTLVNASNVDLSMGPQGAIRNDIYLDMQIRGLHPASFPAVAFDRLAGPLVLKSRQSATRVVRADQGKLLATLRTAPSISLPMTGTAGTNPVILHNPEAIAPGAGGYKVEFTRVLEQYPVPIATREQVATLLDGLTSTGPEQRLPLIDAAVVYYMGLTNSAPPDQQDGLVKLKALIDAQASDPDPTTRTWGTFLGLLVAKGDARQALARSAGFDPYWLVRMMALAGIRGGDIEASRRLAAQLSADPDPTVARFAKAALEELDERAADLAAQPPQPPTPPPGNK